MRPIALSHKCNSFIPKRRGGKHFFACEYSKLALAVWHENPLKFPEFHDWLMEEEKPPPLSVAKSQAMKLVGWRVVSDGVSSDPVKEMLEVNHKSFGEKIKRVPVLLVGDFMAVGIPKESVDFDRLFQAKLDLGGEAAEQQLADTPIREENTNVLLDDSSNPLTQSSDSLAGFGGFTGGNTASQAEDQQEDETDKSDSSESKDDIALDDFFDSL